MSREMNTTKSAMDRIEKAFPRKANAWLYSLWWSAANQLYVARLKDHIDATSDSPAVIHQTTGLVLTFIGTPRAAAKVFF